ncbi:MAG: hypothetical protein JWQ35_2436 [Bacteriovoracaceae bacterium]|nr:hypothetical protein [Bacteriovoracaceae bacterium]
MSSLRLYAEKWISVAMFEQISEVFIHTPKYKILHLYHSLNEPLISPADGLPVQTATATLLVMQDLQKSIEIFIGLFFPDSGKRILYKAPIFQIELLSDRITQAQAFVEQMGFLMDNKNFDKARPEEKKTLIRTIPFFYEDIELFYKALSATEVNFRQRNTESATHEASVDIETVFLEQYLRIASML